MGQVEYQAARGLDLTDLETRRAVHAPHPTGRVGPQAAPDLCPTDQVVQRVARVLFLIGPAV